MAAALVAASWAGTAGASGDYGCTPDWALDRAGFDCAGTALLSPRNDTRINLAFLLRDKAGLTAPGALAYPKRDWDTQGFGHVFASWQSLQSAFWPRPEGEEDGYADGAAYAGTRCQTLESGAAAFRAALAASKVPAGERTALGAARDLLKPACDGEKAEPAWPAGIASAPGREYLAYLKGAWAFYAERGELAEAAFLPLGRSKDGWIAETSTYMVYRNRLARAQAMGLGEWGEWQGGDKVDRAALVAAGSAADTYLKSYPKGLYFASASGLVRRIDWMGGDRAALSRRYAPMLAAAEPIAPAARDLIEEVDNKLLFASGMSGALETPMLLAVSDLMRMRGPDPEGLADVPAPISAAELAAQAGAFAGAPELWSFVQASHAYYVAHDDARVLALIPDDARKPAYGPLAFSRQLLRGLALERLHDPHAAGFWTQLAGGAHDLYQRPAVELAWAMNRERADALAEVYAAGSPVREADIRTLLLARVAGPDLLRRQAGPAGADPVERQVALLTLLTKELSRGRYADFGRDLALVPRDAPSGNGRGAEWDGAWLAGDEGSAVPLGLFTRGTWQDGFACPALAVTAAKLAAVPTDVRAQLCLGEFYRLNGFDDLFAYPAAPKPDELGGTPDRFSGKAIARGGLYAAVLANRAAGADETAYALYRSVMCYAPSGINACGDADVPQAQRKAWYLRLKREFPTSAWASRLKYYW